MTRILLYLVLEGAGDRTPDAFEALNNGPWYLRKIAGGDSANILVIHGMDVKPFYNRGREYADVVAEAIEVLGNDASVVGPFFVTRQSVGVAMSRVYDQKETAGHGIELVRFYWEAIEAIAAYMKGGGEAVYESILSMLESYGRHNPENILALQLLCQGYLAAHCFPGEDPSNRKALADELALSCEVFDASVGAVPAVRDTTIAVREPRWWLECFDVLDPRSGKVDEDKWKDFENRIEAEKKQCRYDDASQKLAGLLAAMKTADQPLDNIDLVRDVCRELRDALLRGTVG